MASIFLIFYITHTHRISMVMFTGLISLLYDISENPTQSLKLSSFWIPSASFHIFSESKQSLSGSLHSCTSTFPPFWNSFTHSASHSYCYLVLRHQFSHQITKAGCKKYSVSIKELLSQYQLCRWVLKCKPMLKLILKV